MFHLDNNSGVSSMPAPAAMQEQSTRWFTEGAGNQSPSWPGQDWYNIIQAELLNVLKESGIAPVKTQFNQLALAIKAIVGNNALLRDNLFSEIKMLGASSQSAARINLGLGTSAILDITTSERDTTAGHVLKVRDFGIGRATNVVTNNVDFNSYNFIQGEHLFVNCNTAKNIPAGLNVTAYYLVYVHGMRDMESSPGLMLVNYAYPEESWFAYGAGPVGNRTWKLYRTYNTGYRPSATDVGALPVSGGTMTGLLVSKYTPSTNTPKIQLITSDDGNGNGDGQTHLAYNNGTATAPKYSHYFRGMGSVTISTRLGCAIEYNLTVGGSASFTGSIVSGGTINPANYSNFDARYYTKAQSDAGYMAKTSAYTKAESDSRYYTKAQSDAGYMAKTSAYTKAESDARYVQDIDHTAAVEKQFYDGQPYTNTHTTDGAHLANIRFYGGMTNSGWFVVRYTRKKINGTWYTLS